MMCILTVMLEELELGIHREGGISYKVMCILTVMLEELELRIDTVGREVIKFWVSSLSCWRS